MDIKIISSKLPQINRRTWLKLKNTHQIFLLATLIGVEGGRCFSPLIKPPYFWTEILLFSGDTNLLANLDGENDCRNFDVVKANGDFLRGTIGLVGDRVTVGFLIFTRNFEDAGGDLMMNLCGVCCDLAIMGDLVLQNLCCCDEGDDRNRGFGKSTVFLAQGRFLGDTRFVVCRFSFPKSPFFGGEFLKLIRERTLCRDGGSDSDRIDCNAPCFSIFLLAFICVFMGCGLYFFWSVSGVLGPSEMVLLALTTAVTTSFAKRLACRISRTVSPTSIAGSDIRRHSPTWNIQSNNLWEDRTYIATNQTGLIWLLITPIAFYQKKTHQLQRRKKY